MRILFQIMTREGDQCHKQGTVVEKGRGRSGSRDGRYEPHAEDYAQGIQARPLLTKCSIPKY